MHVGAYERGRTPARAARDAGAALMISPIFSPRVPKAYSSTRQLTYESKIGFGDLWVRRSMVEEDKYFTKRGLRRGFGLFLPDDRGGMDPWVGAWMVMVWSPSVCSCRVDGRAGIYRTATCDARVV